DLIASALSLHWVNDLPGALLQIRQALRPDGLFLAALAGGDTLAELRHCLLAAEAEVEGGASPRVSPYVDLRDAAGLLQRAGFALPVADIDRLTVLYPDALALMRELRGMGESNLVRERRRTPLRRATLLRAAALYGEKFSDAEGRVRATFEIVYLHGWAPHETQQKPLRPGAASQRLADVLGVREIPAGEKAGRR
ncbi:MAG: SAM-dependent methyltransferase, partial [Reyranellaceae bacterium]